MSGLPWMKLPTSELPKNEGPRVTRAEDRDLIDQELFPDVCVHLATVEAREMLARSPFVAQVTTNNGSFFNDRPRRSHPSWFTRNFDFVYLGWRRAIDRLVLVCTALYLLLHRHHNRSDEIRNDCAVCAGSLSNRVSTMVERAGEGCIF
jgi:hypothetical protein